MFANSIFFYFSLFFFEFLFIFFSKWEDVTLCHVTVVALLPFDSTFPDELVVACGIKIFNMDVMSFLILT